MATIFINYRRSDSRGTTFALREKLLKHFKENELFLDIEGLGGGEDFVNALAKTVSLADVMVVIIGPQWLDARDAEGNPRLHQPDDFVRIEIASAIAQEKKILPVLLEGAQMPSAEDLPNDMKDLSRRNAVELRLNRIEDDAREIAKTLKELVPDKNVSQKKMVRTAAGAAAAALICGTLAGPYLSNWSGVEWAPNPAKADLQTALADLEQERTSAAAASAEATLELEDVTAQAQRDLLKAKTDAHRESEALREAKAVANSALEKARADLASARSATTEERRKATEMRDTVDDLRTDLKEAQVERRQFLEKYRKTNGDLVEVRRISKDLEGQIKDQNLQIVSLENSNENLCENYDVFMEADEDGIDRSFLGNLLKVHCKRVQRDDSP